MTHRLMKYNPAFLSTDELIESFVVRHVDLELIMEAIHHNTGQSNNHILVVGPRGIGKTTLVLRAVAEVVHDAELAQRWHPIVFGEDSYEACSPGEFWLEALFHLAASTKRERWRQTYAELKSEQDETRLRERALAQLMDFADEQGKRILLVVENLNMILGQQIAGDGAWVVRHALLNEPRLMLVGTATSRFEEIENAGKAMYDLFKIHDLKPLNTPDCRTMWSAITREDLSESRVRPIEILTGGNPRLLSIIANFAEKRSFRELMLDLTQLIDEHTEYFKSHLDALPALERKVFVCLADLWDPVGARAVAKAARVDVNTTSSLLNRLMSRGAVVVFEKQRRKKMYQVAERMYNIYHLMRRRGGASGRISAVVNFMVHFYEGEDLVDGAVSIAEEACRLDGELRQDHYLAYEILLQKIPSKELKYKILRVTSEHFFEMPDIPSTIKGSFDLMKSVSLEQARARRAPKSLDGEPRKIAGRKPRDAASWIALGYKLRDAGRVHEAERAFREATKLDEKSAEAWGGLARVLHEEIGRSGEAEAAYRKAIELEPNDGWIWDRLGDLLKELERIDEAYEAYHRATEVAPTNVWAWIDLGHVLNEKLRFEEAYEACHCATELDSTNVWVWIALGDLLKKQGRLEDAYEAYHRATEVDPREEWGWIGLGDLLQGRLDGPEKAEAAYRKALEQNPSAAPGWRKLGEILHEKLGRYEEAETAYRRAIELDPNTARNWGMLGLLLHEKLGKYEEAEAAYRKANELEPVAFGWAKLGELLHEKLGKYGEAEAAYRKAIELEPSVAVGWAKLGELLHEKLGKYEEAEAAYRKVVELEPTVAFGWANLGELMHEKLGKYGEAEAAYRKAIELEPNVEFGWAKLGELLHEKLGKYEEAEAAYRKVVELEPNVALGWANLGELLHEKFGRYEEAEAAYRRAIEIDPNTARNWGMLGLLLHEKLGKYEEAEAAYRKAIELEPNVALGWAELGELLHQKLGRHDEAEASYRKAIELDPNAARNWAMLGLLLHEKLGRYEEAEAAYRKAIELEPTVAFGWAKLGELLHEKLGRYHDAQAAYLSALDLNDENNVVWKHLMRLQMKNLNDPDSALKTAQRYIENANRSSASVIDAACAFADTAPRELYPQVAKWVREAIEKEPEDWHDRLILAYLLVSIGNWKEALEIISRFLTNTEALENAVGDVTDFFIFAAACGYPEEALDAIRVTPSASIMEPLVTGLQIFLGEEPTIAKEILEVGRDVAKRIEVRKKQMRAALDAKV